MSVKLVRIIAAYSIKCYVNIVLDQEMPEPQTYMVTVSSIHKCFHKLHFVPDPVLGDDGTYRNFDALIGYFKN